MKREARWMTAILFVLFTPGIILAGSEPTMLRKIDAQVYVGKGTASISYQCDPEKEKPCPPQSELRRRALQVVKILAMQDICAQAGLEVHTAMEVASGRLDMARVKTRSGHFLKRLEFLDPVIDGDEISIQIVAETE